MSPLLLVGILAMLTVNPSSCDVKHVLDGSAHPPQHADPQEINHLAFAPQGSDQYWWMKHDSPLGNAIDYYKKCTSKGNCPNAPSDINEVEKQYEPKAEQRLNIDSNPFLNGGVHASAGTQFNADGNKVDISKNPFFNGQIQGKPGTVHSGNGDAIKETSNGFIGVQPAQPFRHNSVDCSREGKVCVDKHLCLNGYVNDDGSGLLEVRVNVSVFFLI